MAVKEEVRNGITYRYRKLRNARRISLTINLARVVTVSMPYSVTYAAARAFAEEKESWIEEKLRDSLSGTDTVLRGGNIFRLFGEEYTLYEKKGSRYKLELGEHRALLEIPENANIEKRTQYLRRRFASELRKALDLRLPFWEQITGMRAVSVSVRYMTSRWGSCTYDNRISVNAFIAELPRECLDYLIVHELIHTAVKNHGKAFYEALERYYPDWKRVRKILKS